MPLLIECDSCNTKLKVGDYLAGQKVRCPKCHATMIAPKNDTDEEILEAVDVRPPARKIAPPRLTRRERDDDYEEEDFDEERPAPRRRRRRQAERGSGMVVLSIIGGIVGVLVVVGVVVGAGYLVISQLGDKPVPASAWQSLSPAGAGFTAQMPGSPKYTTQNAGGLLFHLYSVNVGRAEYMVGYCDYPPGVQFSFDGAVQGACAATGGTVTSSSDFTIGPWKGRTFETDVTKPAKGHTITRMVLVKNRLIQVVVGGPNIKADNPDVVKYLNSLKLNGN